eukprot:sb/3461649/
MNFDTNGRRIIWYVASFLLFGKISKQNCTPRKIVTVSILLEDASDTPPDADMAADNVSEAQSEDYFYPTALDIENRYVVEIFKRRTRLWKAFWVVAGILMLGFSIWLVTLLIQDYLTYSSYNLYYSTLSSSYTLPAITICNLNLLDRTRLEKQHLITSDGQNLTYEDIYKGIQMEYSDREGGNSTSINGLDEFEELINGVDFYTNYSMDIKSEIVGDVTFAKSTYSFDAIGEVETTERGSCLDINDDSILVQKVAGPTGGMMITLDAEISKYMSLQAAAGFSVVLRSPNETVISKEFGFSVHPGKRYLINMRTTDVTRVESPWGNCTNQLDIMDLEGYYTTKECFLNQILYSYPGLQSSETDCTCFPWFFVTRFLQNESSRKYDKYVTLRMIYYWTEQIEEENLRLSFNETCYYTDSPIEFTDKKIEIRTNITDKEACAALCGNHDDCRYFMYSSKNNDYLSAKECRLFKSGASYIELTTDNVGNVNTSGLIPGRYFMYSTKNNDYLSAKECRLFKSGASYIELTTDNVGNVNTSGLIPGLPNRIVSNPQPIRTRYLGHVTGYIKEVIWRSHTPFDSQTVRLDMASRRQTENRPNQEILVPDLLITSHVTLSNLETYITRTDRHKYTDQNSLFRSHDWLSAYQYFLIRSVPAILLTAIRKMLVLDTILKRIPMEEQMTLVDVGKKENCKGGSKGDPCLSRETYITRTDRHKYTDQNSLFRSHDWLSAYQYFLIRSVPAILLTAIRKMLVLDTILKRIPMEEQMTLVDERLDHARAKVARHPKFRRLSLLCFASNQKMTLKFSKDLEQEKPEGMVRLCNIYRPPYTGKARFTAASFLEEFVDYLADLNLRTGSPVLMGDFNFQVQDISDFYAEKFLKLLDSFGLEQLTPCQPTHTRGGTLDLVICQSEIKRKFRSVEIQKDGTESDHYMVLSELVTETEDVDFRTKQQVDMYRDFKSVDRELFRQALRNLGLEDLLYRS